MRAATGARRRSVYDSRMPDPIAREPTDAFDRREHPFAAVRPRRAVDEMPSDLQPSLVTYIRFPSDTE